jgi:hypothetical protein
VIEADEIVVLPSGRRALVRIRQGGYLLCCYLKDGKPDYTDVVEVRETLVRTIRNGLVPAPLRLVAG